MSRINFSDTCEYNYDNKMTRVEAYLEPLFFSGRRFKVEKAKEGSYNGRMIVEGRCAKEIKKDRSYFTTILIVASYALVIPVIAALVMKASHRMGPDFLETHIARPNWEITYLSDPVKDLTNQVKDLTNQVKDLTNQVKDLKECDSSDLPHKKKKQRIEAKLIELHKDQNSRKLFRGQRRLRNIASEIMR